MTDEQRMEFASCLGEMFGAFSEAVHLDDPRAEGLIARFIEAKDRAHRALSQNVQDELTWAAIEKGDLQTIGRLLGLPEEVKS